VQILDPVQELLGSVKFRAWRRPFDLQTRQSAVVERHYSPIQLAELWGVSPQTIREIFKDEPGVLQIGRDGTRNRRRYKTMRIPHSVAERVHARLSA
jgi:hypothetical protein